jgi:hypothetical protein
MAERDSSDARVPSTPKDARDKRTETAGEPKTDEHGHRLRGNEYERDFYDAERDGTPGTGRDDLVSDS